MCPEKALLAASFAITTTSLRVVGITFEGDIRRCRWLGIFTRKVSLHQPKCRGSSASSSFIKISLSSLSVAVCEQAHGKGGSVQKELSFRTRRKSVQCAATTATESSLISYGTA